MRRQQWMRGARIGTLWVLIAVMIYFATSSSPRWIVGVTVMTLGESIRFWAAGYLVKIRELITSGPYQFTRNPLYLGRLLIVSGLCIAIRLPYELSLVAMLGFWLYFFLVYMPRKEATEPPRLAAQHGERYHAYFQSVPALFPRWSQWDPQSNSQSWKWRQIRRNREIYMVLAVILIAFYLRLAIP